MSAHAERPVQSIEPGDGVRLRGLPVPDPELTGTIAGAVPGGEVSVPSFTDRDLSPPFLQRLDQRVTRVCDGSGDRVVGERAQALPEGDEVHGVSDRGMPDDRAQGV